MPESRDRLSRPVDVTEIFARRRRTIHGLNIFTDDAAEEISGVTPTRWGTTPMTGLQGQVAAAGGVLRGNLGTPRSAIRRGQENTRRGRGRRTVLPSWYPRAPLRDITAITRAIQRRRASLRETEGLQLGTPRPQGQIAEEPYYANPTINAQLEHINLHKSPTPTAGKKPSCPPSVAKILLNITNQKEERKDPDFLTPQKRLVNSIDTVGRAVMEELEKMKKTPFAKRAIRERKVRTLMSMR